MRLCVPSPTRLSFGHRHGDPAASLVEEYIIETPLEIRGPARRRYRPRAPGIDKVLRLAVPPPVILPSAYVCASFRHIIEHVIEAVRKISSPAGR